MKLDDMARGAAEGIRAAAQAGEDAGSASGSIERFERYRARRERNRRVGTVVVAAAITLGVMVAMVRAFGPGHPSEPAKPGPANGRILFGRNDHSRTVPDWFTRNPDGSGLQDLGLTAGCTSWWPDGSKLLTDNEGAAGPGEPLRPATIRPDGSGFHTLDGTSDPQLNLACGDVSPDGTRIVLEGFNDRLPEAKGIYSVRASDGGGLERLTSGFDAIPLYSPDGRTVAFTRTLAGDTEGETSALFVMNADGSGAHRITPRFTTLDKAWSPDGRWIVFQRSFGKLYLVHPDGRGLHEIPIAYPDGVGSAFYPTWSPDGSRIAFSLQAPGNWDIYTVRPDGSGLQRVTNTPRILESTPDWGPSYQQASR